MQYKKAYVAGFLKTAEEHGLDSRILLKAAMMAEKDAEGFFDNPGQWISSKADSATRLFNKGKNWLSHKFDDLHNAAELNKKLGPYVDKVKPVADFFRNMDPDIRRALIGSLIFGVGSMLFSGENKLPKALGSALVGGLGTYALSRSGGYDAARDYLTRKFYKDNAVTPQPPAVQQNNGVNPAQNQ